MSPVANIMTPAARASASSDVAPLDPLGNPAITAVLISVPIIFLTAAFLILYRLWCSHWKGRVTKASLDEFDMPELTRKLNGSNINKIGRTPLPSVMLTQVIDISRTRTSTRPSVIDISPEGALRLGLTRQSTPPLPKTDSILSIPTFVQMDESSNSRLPIAHHRATSVQSLTPSIAGIAEQPPPALSQAGSSYPLRTLQLPEMLTQPEPFFPEGLFASSSSSRSRSESEASLFSFIQNRAPSIRAENDDTSAAPPIHIPAAAAAGYARRPFGGQVVSGNKLSDVGQIRTNCTYNTESTAPIIRSTQDSRQTLPPPWFEPTASTSRAHQPAIEISSRIQSRGLAITIPEPLLTIRRYSSHHPCRTLSTATNLMTPPPPPYTPLDTAFEIPPLPQKALLRSSQRPIPSTTSPADGPTLGYPPTQQTPVYISCTNDSKASLRSQLNQQQERSNDQGIARHSRPRSNSLPFRNVSLSSGPKLARGQPRVGTLSPLRIGTGAEVTGRAWLPGTIDEIISTTPGRGTFTIDE